MPKKNISDPVIRRLPRYYRFLNDLYHNGQVRISSNELAKAMGLTASQIRQDLSRFGSFGTQGFGYGVESLRDALMDILGINDDFTAVILGAGHLGHALIRNFEFGCYGFQLIAAFDVDPALTGSTLAGIPIYHLDDLEKELARLRPDVGILTTPRSVASAAANRLAAAGVPGLWNFTNVELKLNEPEKVIVEDIHFSDSLLAMRYMLKTKQPARCCFQEIFNMKGKKATHEF